MAVDDEPLALQLLEDYVTKIPFLKLGASCSSAYEAKEVLQNHNIDLIFIDIQMPGLTGLQFIESLTSRPMIILVTAYEKFALEGFNLNVVDYLLKPIELIRFIQACNKAEELYQLKQLRSTGIINPDYFFVNAYYSLVKIMFDDIMWIEGLKDYVKIYLKSSSKPMMIRTTLKALEHELPLSKFIRIHRSYIITINAITSIRKNSIYIGESEFPIGDTYKDIISLLTRKSEL